jgi:hypothetical protein
MARASPDLSLGVMDLDARNHVRIGPADPLLHRDTVLLPLVESNFVVSEHRALYIDNASQHSYGGKADYECDF